MAMTLVQQVLSDPSLVPWIEEQALNYAKHRFVMATRVLTKTDMQGWNDRKVSQVQRPGNASQLQEATDIPESKHFRKRLASIAPEEWGDLYQISDRRIDTDPENVLADVIEALGYSLGRRREQKFFSAAIGNANLTLTAAGAYTIDQAVQLQTEFESRAWSGQLYHVIHPFQELDVKVELLKLSNAAVPDFRNQFIRQWSYGGFGGLNIAVSSMVPRKVVSRIVFPGPPVAAETFRLRFGLVDTADIAIGANAAGTLTNILAALNALTPEMGTWTGSGATYTTLKVTSPAFVDQESQLTYGYDSDGDLVDNVTGGFRIEEVSATARAPFFQPQGIIHDVRKGLQVYQEWFNRKRVLEIGAYETYGIGAWEAERLAYIETDATSPLAVAD